ncbi:hypothetical protein BVC71_05475 [Marivivens niveibacter]|uniref:Methyltransferase FkbM domain-containing protein n=1 Tax=Marivivens niveibacter TaxID=1930667 RepID=A0A251X2T2_9RHOB|nr:FkbM family methyltransferase [Marivivens niveibacter]OUD10916.1 hypothetical protein BVC71_05475 [Marivivens niveibacter]
MPPAKTDHNSRKVLTSTLHPAKQMVIADVGANPLGEPPYKGLLDDGACQVVGFEPNLDALAELEQIKSENETYLPNAIGMPGKQTLYLHKRSGFTSLYPMDRENLRRIDKERLANMIVDKVELETTPLDNIADVPLVDVLKMDLQGGERDVMIGGKEKLANAVGIVTEVRFYRIYENEPEFGDLDRQMRDQGFRLYKFLFQKSVMMPHPYEEKIIRKRMTSQLFDGDAVYLPNCDLANDLTDDQLIYLSFFGDMIESPDLTLLALGALTKRGVIGNDVAETYINALSPRLRANG